MGVASFAFKLAFSGNEIMQDSICVYTRPGPDVRRGKLRKM